MIAGVFCIARPETSRGAAAGGALLGVGVLFRPQILVLTAIVAVRLAIDAKRTRARRLGFFLIGFALAYGPWPIHNFVHHGRVVLTQDLRAFKNWAPDVISFMQYMYSVQAGWEPQFGQLVTNQPVTFPAASGAVPADRPKLEAAVALAQRCGSGLRHWKQSALPPIAGPNCDTEVARLFGELRESQYRNNPVNAYVRVPLQNLRKALFKQSLTDTSSRARKLASLLFLYRTALLVVGVGAAAVILRRRADPTGVVWIALVYFACWYLLLCAGTLTQLRNIEMRYLLPAAIGDD
jgi:hypothetical protein